MESLLACKMSSHSLTRKGDRAWVCYFVQLILGTWLISEYVFRRAPSPFSSTKLINVIIGFAAIDDIDTD